MPAPIAFAELLLVVAPLLVKEWERWTKSKAKKRRVRGRRKR